MTKKKPQGALGLPSLPPPSANLTASSLITYAGSSAITPREIEILENLHEDKVVIEAIEDKAKFGLEQMNEVKWFGATDVWFTMQQIEEVRQEAQGTNCQAAMDEFCTYLINLSARHTLGVIEVSAGKIAEVIGESVLPPVRSPAPEPAPAPRKGFLTRLLGG